MMPIIDPRHGDIEDDASSPKHRSLLALAGTLLAEISLSKLVVSLLVTFVLPALLVGAVPIVATAGYALLSNRVAAAFTGIAPVLTVAALLALVALAWFGGRTLLRAAERSFWSLESLIVQPGYVLGREAIRHLAERILPTRARPETRRRVRGASAVAAGLVLVVVGLWLAGLAWPGTRWLGSISDLAAPLRLVGPALANSLVIVGVFLAAASLAFGIADAWMDQPQDLERGDASAPGARSWRVAHLSDLHVVGGRYEFRIESGRRGPRGNGTVHAALDRLDAIDAGRRLDVILVTGDMTDAGRSVEWAELFAALSRHPHLTERMLLLPGNHDLNIVDRMNPARFELPTSTGKRLRQMRALSAIAAIQGDRVHVIDRHTGRLGPTLSEAIAPHRDAMREFADTGRLRLSARLDTLWQDMFPMVLPPATADGLGIALLNSNAESQFSFTNALGLVSAVQTRDLLAAIEQFPQACWLIALHHHLVEYPGRVTRLSVRIGTALINGSWFVRRLRPLGRRIVALHGHRHIDWVGACGPTRIVSAPSPVMADPTGTPSGFHVHTLEIGMAGQLALLASERVDLAEDGFPPTL
jgi:3',5'-cyclic AMP phosphodiesterase CpdA